MICTISPRASYKCSGMVQMEANVQELIKSIVEAFPIR